MRYSAYLVESKNVCGDGSSLTVRSVRPPDSLLSIYPTSGLFVKGITSATSVAISCDRWGSAILSASPDIFGEFLLHTLPEPLQAGDELSIHRTMPDGTEEVTDVVIGALVPGTPEVRRYIAGQLLRLVSGEPPEVISTEQPSEQQMFTVAEYKVLTSSSDVLAAYRMKAGMVASELSAHYGQQFLRHDTVTPTGHTYDTESEVVDTDKQGEPCNNVCAPDV